MSEHVIEFFEMENERTSWECDCGRAGSASSHSVDIAAEKHIPEGEGASYRYPGR